MPRVAPRMRSAIIEACFRLSTADSFLIFVIGVAVQRRDSRTGNKYILLVVLVSVLWRFSAAAIRGMQHRVVHTEERNNWR